MEIYWKENGGIRNQEEPFLRKIEQKTAFHTGASTRMSVPLAWVSRKIVHLNNFYKGDPWKCQQKGEKEELKAQAQHVHHHLHA